MKPERMTDHQLKQSVVLLRLMLQRAEPGSDQSIMLALRLDKIFAEMARRVVAQRRSGRID